MSSDIVRLEEVIATLQHELMQLTQEVYSQQKEISALGLEIEKLTARLRHVQSDSGILKPEEDTPPPHY